MGFKQDFFKIYDRKIASGEVTFSRTGIKKDDFTRLCTEDGFVFSEETILMISETMKLSEEEKNLLLREAKEESN